MNRFLFIAGENRAGLKSALLLLYLLPGSPIVYNGTELFVSQERNIRTTSGEFPEETRQPMDWSKEGQDSLEKYLFNLLKRLNRRLSMKRWL